MFGKSLGTEALTYQSSSRYLLADNLEVLSELLEVPAYIVDVYFENPDPIEITTEVLALVWRYYGAEVYSTNRTSLVHKDAQRTLIVPTPLDRTSLVPKAQERKVKVL